MRYKDLKRIINTYLKPKENKECKEKPKKK
jgi:hypothetical protein